MISPRPRFPLSAPGTAPKKGSLTTKQALLTLLIALLISSVAGSIELFSHATNMRQEVQLVSIRDDFGRALAEFNTPEQADSTWLSQHLFGDILHHQTALQYYMGSDMPEAIVGEIELMLSEGYLTQQFLTRIYAVVGFSILEAFFLSILVIAFFHVFITRPLLKVHAAIAQTDPNRLHSFPTRRSSDLPWSVAQTSVTRPPP